MGSGFLLHPIALNSDGQATQLHITDRAYGNGEVTLCGHWIDYTVYTGDSPEAQPCTTCSRARGGA